MPPTSAVPTSTTVRFGLDRIGATGLAVVADRTVVVHVGARHDEVRPGSTSSIRYCVAVPQHAHRRLRARRGRRVSVRSSTTYCRPASGSSVAVVTCSVTVTRFVPAVETNSTQPAWLPGASPERSASIVYRPSPLASTSAPLTRSHGAEVRTSVIVSVPEPPFSDRDVGVRADVAQVERGRRHDRAQEAAASRRLARRARPRTRRSSRRRVRHGRPRRCPA